MRKIGELKGKPIIEGNPNEIKKNQIHYKESDGNITLSERKGDNTLSSVTSGSGSGEGVKEYYYKVLNDIFDADTNILLQVLSTYTIDSVIVPIEVYGNHTIVADVNASLFNAMSGIMKAKGNIKGIKLLDNFDGFWGYLDWAANSEPNFFEKMPKGNIITKVLSVATEDTPQEEINQAVELINSYVQEITKEEYESMITYKPE